MANVEVPTGGPAEDLPMAEPLSEREYRQDLRGQRARVVDPSDMFSHIRAIGRLQRRIESGRATGTAHARLNRLYDELATMRIARGARPSVANLNGLRDELQRIRPREPHRAAAVSVAMGNIDDALAPALARRERRLARRVEAPSVQRRVAPNALRRAPVTETVVERESVLTGTLPRTARGGFNGAVAGAGFGVGSALGGVVSRTVLSGTPYGMLAPIVGGVAGGVYANRLGEGSGFTRLPLRATALAAAAYLVPGARTAIAVSAAGGAALSALRRGGE